MSSEDQPKPSKPRPGRGAEAAAREAERRERLAAALRRNLRKRKAPAKPGLPDPDA